MTSKLIKVHRIYANPTIAPSGNVTNHVKLIFGFSNLKLVEVVIKFAHMSQNWLKLEYSTPIEA